MKKHTNERYEIEAAAPLLRPGMKITATCSSKYVVHVAAKLMEFVRDINKGRA